MERTLGEPGRKGAVSRMERTPREPGGRKGAVSRMERTPREPGGTWGGRLAPPMYQ